MQELAKTCNMDRCRLRGASAGALAAALGACEVDAGLAFEKAYDLARQHGAFDRPLGLVGVWGGMVRTWLEDILPEDAADRLRGRVQVVLTELPMKKRAVDDFQSKEDVIEALMASVHVASCFECCRCPFRFCTI
jgi:predicted acylesterase/phospholipase RssA